MAVWTMDGRPARPGELVLNQAARIQPGLAAPTKWKNNLHLIVALLAAAVFANSPIAHSIVLGSLKNGSFSLPVWPPSRAPKQQRWPAREPSSGRQPAGSDSGRADGRRHAIETFADDKHSIEPV